jgi:hypothetical protein
MQGDSTIWRNQALSSEGIASYLIQLIIIASLYRDVHSSSTAKGKAQRGDRPRGFGLWIISSHAKAFDSRKFG